MAISSASPLYIGNATRGPLVTEPPGRVVEIGYVSPVTESLTANLYHSADTNRDYRIDLSELQRVIDLYNTRYTSPEGVVTRTGCYKIDPSTIDGFASDPSRLAATSVQLSKYHSADINKDGHITLLELVRVIEIYNQRRNGVRTGQYHVQQGTEDGFGLGPE